VVECGHFFSFFDLRRKENDFFFFDLDGVSSSSSFSACDRTCSVNDRRSATAGGAASWG
jgi:hypothetical protein